MSPIDAYCYFCGVVVAVSLVIYVAPLALLSLVPSLRKQNLRAKYGDWALVTGASSGIGLAVARKFAGQGINVVVAALDDKLLAPAVGALRKGYPNVQIVSVPVNLAEKPELYMKAIRDATDDKPISLVVNNAGFLRMGYFDETDVERHVENVECNALAAIRITHHFYNRMADEKRKGFIGFTSSAAWFMPAPYALMYGASKAMLSNFATSLAIEAQNHNVDITVGASCFFTFQATGVSEGQQRATTVLTASFFLLPIRAELLVHPSYTHTGLYKGQPQLDVLKVLSRFGWTPDDVADVLVASAGRVIVRDAGVYSVLTNILGRVVDANSLASVIVPFRSGMAPPPKPRS